MKKWPKYLYLLVYAAVAAVAVALDQISKSVMANLLADGRQISVIGNWMTLSWTTNAGSAFGGMQGKSVLFFVCTLIGLPIFVWLLLRAQKRSVFGQVGYALIIGGTIGNAIDRLFLGDGFFNGRVRDFIAVKGFAVFNVADSFLVVGVILAVVAILFLDPDAVVKGIGKKSAAEEAASTSSDKAQSDANVSDGPRNED